MTGRVADPVIARLKRGDEETYTRLFRDFYAPLASYSVNFTGDSQASEDIVQNFFCKLWEDRRALSENKSLKAYLYVSIRNLSLNYIRDRRTHSLDGFDPSSGDDIMLEILREEVYSELYRAIQQLPDRCRNILTLKLEGIDNKEIARRMDITEDTVRSQLRHGKTLVRDIITRVVISFLFLPHSF